MNIKLNNLHFYFSLLVRSIECFHKIFTVPNCMQSSKLICYLYFPLIIHYLVLTKFLSNFQKEYCEVPRFFLSLIEKFNSPITRCRLVRTFPFSYHNILLKQLESHRRNENKALAFSPFAVASSS